MKFYAPAEAITLVLFLFHARAAMRRGRWQVGVLFAGAAYGVLVEHFNQEWTRSYSYPDDYTLVLGLSPVMIGLVWGMIIVGSMSLADALNVPDRSRPFVDTLLALSLDLAFDAIAIRIGMWQWHGYSHDEGWFGVPFGNFVGWIVVVLAFSWIVRRSRYHPRRSVILMAAPMIAYCLQFSGIVAFAVIQRALGRSDGVAGAAIFGILLLAIVYLAGHRGVSRPFARDRAGLLSSGAFVSLREALRIRALIHISFFLALLVVDGGNLPLVAVTTLLGGTEVAFAVALLRPRVLDVACPLTSDLPWTAAGRVGLDAH